MINKAMLLAAGKGVRLRPITETAPKPLVEVGGRALLDWSLARLLDAGVEDVVVNLHYLGAMIEERLSGRTKPTIAFCREEELLETGGGVLAALPILGAEPFYVVNGDALWLNGSMDALERLKRAWNDERMDGLLLLHSTVDAYGYNGLGDFNAAPDGTLTRRPEGEVSPYLFTGVQILHRRAFDGLRAGCFSLNRVYDRVLAEGRLFGIVHDGEWFHIGTPQGLCEAETYMSLRYAETRHR
ncbi:MAG TPA: nucleotidyltransferase family protein [Alphaproteobacteria bacterium]|nr:nucleotidyltransferase family protein [Alphaproteobacteria bacterium]